MSNGKKGTVEEVKRAVKTEVEKGRARAEKEIEKMKKRLGGAYAKVESYARKNPEKAALITATVGAAIGAALTKYLSAKPKGKK